MSNPPIHSHSPAGPPTVPHAPSPSALGQLIRSVAAVLRIGPRRWRRRFDPAPDGTPSQPNLAHLGVPRGPASLRAGDIVRDGQPLVPLGGDYWMDTRFPLGPAYAV